MRAATGQSEPGIDLSKIRELEERLDKFRIQTSSDMTIRGNAWQGYALNAYTCDELGLGGGPPTPTIGACCLPDGTCEEVTVAQCIEDGGTFVGGLCDDADCPQPPPPTGACCVGTDCTIETEDDCTDMDGTYQGDDTTCDPNPCTLPNCPCTTSQILPFYDTITDAYYSSVTSDCCAETTTYSGAVSKYIRFSGLVSSNSVCDDFGFSGTNDCTYALDETCTVVQTSCSGTITDEHDNCVEDCTGECPCLTGSCSVHTSNTTTLVDPCQLLTGACCVGSDCMQVVSPECTDLGGFYYGDGTSCGDVTCGGATGACCTDGVCTEGVSEATCTGGGGTYIGDGTSCFDDANGACCAFGTCFDNFDCSFCVNSFGGTCHPCAPCDPDPCA